MLCVRVRVCVCVCVCVRARARVHVRVRVRAQRLVEAAEEAHHQHEENPDLEVSPLVSRH